MKLASTCTLEAPPAEVFGAITDPEVLQACLSDCESMDQTPEGTYTARFRIGVAGLRGIYTGKIRLLDPKPPASFTLAVEGKGGAGWVRGQARFRLEPAGGRTVLMADGEGQVGGLIAAVGSRIIEAAARGMMDKFFQKLAQHFE